MSLDRLIEQIWELDLPDLVRSARMSGEAVEAPPADQDRHHGVLLVRSDPYPVRKERMQ